MTTNTTYTAEDGSTLTNQWAEGYEPSASAKRSATFIPSPADPKFKRCECAICGATKTYVEIADVWVHTNGLEECTGKRNISRTYIGRQDVTLTGEQDERLWTGGNIVGLPLTCDYCDQPAAWSTPNGPMVNVACYDLRHIAFAESVGGGVPPERLLDKLHDCICN